LPPIVSANRAAIGRPSLLPPTRPVGVRSRVVDGGGGTKSGVPWWPCANEVHQTPQRGAGVRRVEKGTEMPGQAPATLVVRDVLTQLAREGARKMLAQALDDEVAAYVAAAVDDRDEQGRRLVVRNGHAQEREVQTGVG